jgi:hypothetical protein
VTRKDFQLIADVVASLDVILPDPDRKLVATLFAKALEADNPAFKRGAFLTACGVTS